MKNLKKLTILHSNDLHGDFTAEKVDQGLLGGVSLLSGYVHQVRKEEKNVLYAVAGDMFRGSVIDSEYKGISTIEIMNMLSPDVATLGNHEVDYGIAHLLFIEKCAQFPIINANMYLTTNRQTRLFKSHVILEVDGMKIMFIGILTEEVLAQARQERLIGSFVNVHEAATEIGKICNTHRTEDIDFTVLLTHIGFKEDQMLAELLDPNWGIDVIIGGHSHTLMQEPCVVKGIPIVQAATGTNQIGRFDIMIDTDTNSIDSYTWQLIPINDQNCPRDLELEELLSKYQEATDEKYDRYITRLADTYTHSVRNRETQLGKIFADLFRDCFNVDIMLIGSGDIRVRAMKPLVLFRNLTEAFPYHDEFYRVTVTGKQLKRMIHYLFRPEALNGGHKEFYQFSRGLRFVVSIPEQRVLEITYEGEPIDDERLFRIGLQRYHLKNLKEFLDVSEEEAAANAPFKILATNAMDVLDETLSHTELVRCPEDQRWITISE